MDCGERYEGMIDHRSYYTNRKCVILSVKHNSVMANKTATPKMMPVLSLFTF